MKQHIAVLGTGMAGRAIVYDLSQKHRITAAAAASMLLDGLPGKKAGKLSAHPNLRILSKPLFAERKGGSDVGKF